MKNLTHRIGQWPIGVSIEMLLVLILAMILLSGCATDGAAPKADEPLNANEASTAYYIAMQKIGETGDAETKRMAIFAATVAKMGGQGGTAAQVVLQGPRTVGDAIFGFLDRTLERALAVAPAYLAYKGQVRSAQTTETVAAINRDVSLNQSNNFLALGAAGIGGTATVGVAGMNALANVGTSLATRPITPTTNVSGNVGPVLIGGGSYYGPVTRNCQGGNGQAGTGTATIPAGAGAAGSANC